MNVTIKEMTNEELEALVKTETFKEDKALTTKLLFDAVKSSRSFQNLTDMYYEEKDGMENVILVFTHNNGLENVWNETVKVNVNWDSCIALMYDVINALHNIA